MIYHFHIVAYIYFVYDYEIMRKSDEAWHKNYNTIVMRKKIVDPSFTI